MAETPELTLQQQYDALAAELTKANKDLQEKLTEAISDRNKAESKESSLQTDYSDLSNKHNDALDALVKAREEARAAHEQVETLQTQLEVVTGQLNSALNAAKSALPPAQQAYIYDPNQCRPVSPVKGATCPRCGWIFGGTRPQDKEPHPVENSH